MIPSKAHGPQSSVSPVEDEKANYSAQIAHITISWHTLVEVVLHRNGGLNVRAASLVGLTAEPADDRGGPGQHISGTARRCLREMSEPNYKV
jgi:hypothetical protein